VTTNFSNSVRLPKNWTNVLLGIIADINVRPDTSHLNDDSDVTFVPMRCVEPLTGRIDQSNKRKYLQVKKGYTAFQEGDLLFAKITPCMENGKVAIADKLTNHIGFGSTEFHIVRLPYQFPKNFFFHFCIQEQVRKNAQRNMKGTAGQLRVPHQYLEQLQIPLPPLAEQRRIVAKIEELFTRLDAGVEALKKVKAELKRYRQAVLKYAFEGKLTAEWREKNKDKLEPASKLLERIAKEQGKTAKGKTKKLPPLDTSELPELPKEWAWTTVGQISDNIQYGYTAKATSEAIGPKLLRITDIQNNTVSWDSVPYCRIDKDDKWKYTLNQGDLLFARTGATVGKSFLIKGKIPEAIFASYLIRIIINKVVDNEFVYKFFQSNKYWLQISKGQLGIGQPNVNGQILSRITLPIPSASEQRQIVAEIERHFSIADEVEQTIEKCLKESDRLRHSILKRAFEGKLVEQNPADEPAEELLKRIKAERAKLQTEQKTKKRGVKAREGK